VEAEDLIFNECSERKVIEKVREIFPDIGVAIFTQALVVESINLSDLARLVVSTEDGDALGVTDFKANEERNGFYGVITTVDIIT
jgi:hypothetical protein